MLSYSFRPRHVGSHAIVISCLSPYTPNVLALIFCPSPACRLSCHPHILSVSQYSVIVPTFSLSNPIQIEIYYYYCYILFDCTVSDPRKIPKLRSCYLRRCCPRSNSFLDLMSPLRFHLLLSPTNLTFPLSNRIEYSGSFAVTPPVWFSTGRYTLRKHIHLYVSLNDVGIVISA